MSLNPFDLLQYRCGAITFLVLLVLAVSLGLTLARIANRHINPESAARDKRPIGPFERWLERLLLTRSGQLALHCLVYAIFPLLAIFTRSSLEAEFRALDSGRTGELKTHAILASIYEMFGLSGAITAIRVMTGLSVLIGALLILERLRSFRKSRRMRDA